MATVELVLPRPHPGQRAIMDGAKRFNVVACGRRFGKTTLGGILLARPMLQGGRNCGWFAPTYRLLEEAFAEHRRLYRPVITRAVQSPSPRIELINGTAVDYWTLADPSIVARGRKYARVVIDEAAMAPHLEEAWTQAVRPTLTDHVGDAFFFSTPKGRNFFATLYGMADHDPEWTRWQMPTTDNPWMPPAEIVAARASLPSIAFMQEYLAQFVDADGARVKREWLRYGPPPIGKPMYMGVDLAISTKTDADYTSAVVISKDDDGTVYVIDAARVRAPFEGVLRFVRDMAAKWEPESIAIEQVQYQAAVIQELLRTTRLPVRGIKPDKDKLTRFGPMEARYEQGLVVHTPGLPAWFQEELLSFPIGAHDDTVDALSYAWLASNRKRSFSAV